MDFDKVQIIKKYGGDEKNSGDTKAQIALLTQKISYLSTHLKEHSKDHSSRVGLMKIVGQRKRLLEYLKNKNYDVYKSLIQDLGIRK